MATLACPVCGASGTVTNTKKAADGKSVTIVVSFPCPHFKNNGKEVVASPARMENTPAPQHDRTDF